MSYTTRNKNERDFIKLLESDISNDNTIEIKIPRGTNPISIDLENKHSVITYKTNNIDVLTPIIFETFTNGIEMTLHSLYVDNSENDSDVNLLFKTDKFKVLTEDEDNYNSIKGYIITVDKYKSKNFIGTIRNGIFYLLPGFED